MITVSSAQLYAWIAEFLWPLTRILGLLAAAPLFNHTAIPPRVKVGLGVLIAVLVGPTVGPLPGADPFSATGVAILFHQLMTGLAMGFMMRLVFAAVDLAGEIISMTMGLSFATFYDPSSQGHTSAISRFMSLLTLMVLLAIDAHLHIISVLANSFQTFPIAPPSVASFQFRSIVLGAGSIFSFALQLALPVAGALLITNLALGILTRAAPQLNIFAIGFPITLATGFVVLTLSLTPMASPLQQQIRHAVKQVEKAVSAAATVAPAAQR